MDKWTTEDAPYFALQGEQDFEPLRAPVVQGETGAPVASLDWARVGRLLLARGVADLQVEGAPCVVCLGYRCEFCPKVEG